MTAQLLFSVICDDQPGIVERLAAVVRKREGNWLESSLSQIAGKFVGVIQASVPDANADQLVQDLERLGSAHLAITVVRITTSPTGLPRLVWSFSIYGNDRPGIIQEVSQAFAKRHINLEKLSSRISSIPHIGTPLFEAEGRISIPDNIDFEELEAELIKISDELAVDIQLEPVNVS